MKNKQVGAKRMCTIDKPKLQFFEHQRWKLGFQRSKKRTVERMEKGEMEGT